MKRLMFFLLLPICLNAQTYPFHEGFEGLPSTQVPPGWGGSMQVLLYHGRNDSKGLAARISSAVTVDSAITPLIGPLTSTTSFSFYYRIIDFAFYPDGNATNLDAGDQVEIMLSTDSVNFQTVMLIDMNNHNPSFNFVKKKIFVTQHAGESALFKIRCQFGTGAAYYVDFDTIVVDNDTQLGIEDVQEKQFSIAPNPASSDVSIHCSSALHEEAVTVYNLLGEVFLEGELRNLYQLPISAWPNGVYYVTVGDKAKKITRQLIVHH